jgi:phosphatidylglycerophosphate synthase
MATEAKVLRSKGLNAPASAAEGQAPTPAGFQDAVRIQEAVTARLERRVLAWLAPRMPSWVNSDHLTLLGIVAMFLAGASYALARWDRVGLILATVCLALNWFGDSLDGTLARVRNRQRPRYGFYVDHVTDALGGLFLMGGLALSGFVDGRIALGMLIGYLLLSIESYLAAYTLGEFHLSYGKFGPTELRILLAIGNIALWIQPDTRVAGTAYRLFDVGGAIAIAGMIVMLVVVMVRRTMVLYREETLD